MRRLLPILLIACVAYAAWYALRDRLDAPLRGPAIMSAPQDVRWVSIDGPEEDIRLEKGGDGRWTVSRERLVLFGQDERIERFLSDVCALRTDSVLTEPPYGARRYRIGLHRAEGTEILELLLPANAEVPAALRIGRGGDVYALADDLRAWPRRYLRFDAYRELRLRPAGAPAPDSLRFRPAADSLAEGWSWTFGDSTKRGSPPDTTPSTIAPMNAGPLARLLAPARRRPNETNAPGMNEVGYADFFDEIRHADRFFGTVTLYAGADSSRIRVFRDSAWARPYVVVSDAYPRRFLSMPALR